MTDISHIMFEIFQMVKGRLFIFFAVMTVATESDSASLYPKKPYGVKMCYELCRSLTECGVSYREKSLACDLRVQKPPTRDPHQTKGYVTAEGNDIRRMLVSRGGQRVFVYIGVKTHETHTATVPNSVLASTTSPESRHAKIHITRLRVSSKPPAVMSMTPSMTHHNSMYLLTRSHRQYYIQVVNITTSQLLTYRHKLRDNRSSAPVQLYNGTCVRHTSGKCIRVLYVDRHIYTAALKEDPLHPQLQEDTNMRVLRLHDAPTFCFTFKTSELYCLNTRSIYKLQCTGHFTEDGKVNDSRRVIVSRGGQRVFVSFGVKTQEPPTATVPKNVKKSTTSSESRYPRIHTKRLLINRKSLDVLSMSPSFSHRNIMYLLTRSNRQYYIQVVNITTSQLLAYRHKLRYREDSTPAQLYNGTCVRNTSRTCVRVLYVARFIYSAALEEDQLRPQLQEDTNIRVPSLLGAPTFCFTFKSSEVYCLNIEGMFMLDCNVSTCLIRHLPQTLWLPVSLTDVKIDPYTWDRVVTVSKYAVNVAIFDHDKGSFTNAETLRIRCKTVAWFNFFMYYFV